ncbi:hypothetical protein ADK75_30165 [Streptomyces virginiae]|uniref:Uncharacterized protein n=1 Tax=Streptomyces virginiae TaxID=1961 RepID=A0A0L8M5Q4_STRVG|nr:hypothetical protein [Streptomyces virginiae]KOG45723.1 hypothetical protein ADK75_30165 [Streptomyces virginiae]
MPDQPHTPEDGEGTSTAWRRATNIAKTVAVGALAVGALALLGRLGGGQPPTTDEAPEQERTPEAEFASIVREVGAGRDTKVVSVNGFTAELGIRSRSGRSYGQAHVYYDVEAGRVGAGDMYGGTAKLGGFVRELEERLAEVWPVGV